MSRYAALFERLGGEGAFGAFLMLGDPDLETSAALLDAVVEGGADMVEVGIPFSDPIADGPIIQAAAERALNAGVKVADCFKLIAAFRDRHPDVPIGILTYANLVVARGRTDFLARSGEGGADSLLIADLPAIEAEPWAEDMIACGIEPVLVAASNTPAATLDRIRALSKAYVYCVTRAGVTGTHAEARFDRRLLESLKGGPPPVFGFGISTPEQVRAALAAGAAGVICGSAIVDCAARGGDVPALVASLKSATRNESAAN